MTPDVVAQLVVALLDDPTIAALVAEHRPADRGELSPTVDADGAAEFLHLPVTTVRQYARNGRLTAFKAGRQWVFFREDLERLLRQGRLAA